MIVLDKKKKEINIIRDKVGIKPLYYYQVDKKVFFSTKLIELISMLKQNDIIIEIDKYRFSSFIKNGTEPPIYRSSTIYKNIRILRSGHFLNINLTKIEEIFYWNNLNKINKGITDNQHLTNTCLSILKSAVEIRINKQITGILLSGGIDSAVLATLAKPYCNLYAIGSIYKSFPWNEEKGFLKVVSHLYLSYSILDVSDCFMNLNSDVIYYLPEPHEQAYLSSIIFKYKPIIQENNIDVILTGYGADEVFDPFTFISENDTHGSINQCEWLIPEVISSKIPHYLISKQRTTEEMKVILSSSLYDENQGIYSFLGVDRRDPFWDSRLVEFVLSISQNAFAEWGGGKNFLKQLSKKVLDDEIYKTRKTDSNHSYNDLLTAAFKRERPKIVKLFSQKRCILENMGIINKEKFIKNVLKFNYINIDLYKLNMIMRTYLSEFWLRNNRYICIEPTFLE